MLEKIIDKSNIEIVSIKKMGNIEDVKLILNTVEISLSNDYVEFLNSCEYVHVKKNNEQIVLFDSLSVIHENSLDILSNMDITIEFICVGKFVGTERYLILKKGMSGIGIYDNLEYSEKMLAKTIEEFFKT